MWLVRRVRMLARRAPDYVGSPWVFVAALAGTLAWLALGPLLNWSDAWLVLPATATSIGAFLIVLILQYSQNRDTRALQLKLDELIRGLAEARTDLIRLEERTDDELDVIEEEFTRLREDTGEVQPGGGE